MSTDIAPKAAFGRIRVGQHEWTSVSDASTDLGFSDLGEYSASGDSRARLRDEPASATVSYVLLIDEPTSAYRHAEIDAESISLLAYLRAMWSILSSAFTHPLQTAVIDLTTGKVIERRSC